MCRNDDDIVAMDTEVPIDENEEREVHQEEDDEEDNDVDEMDQDILEDDEEIHEEEDEGQDDIQMEMQRDAARREWEAMNVVSPFTLIDRSIRPRHVDV